MQSTSCFLRPACLVLAALLPIFATLDAHAQRRSNTRGIFLNAHLNATSISYDEDEFPNEDNTDAGGGLGVEIGYGVSPLVTIYLGLNGSAMETDDPDVDSYSLTHVDLGVLLNIGAGRSRAVPYVDLALTGRQVTFDFPNGNLEFRGAGVTLGGGLKYFLSPVLALDGGLGVTLGTFSEAESGIVTVQINDVSAVSARLAFGLSWYPMRR